MADLSAEQFATIGTALGALIVSAWAKLSKKESVDARQTKRIAEALSLAQEAQGRAAAAEQAAAAASTAQQEAAEAYASSVASIARRVENLEGAAVSKEEFESLSGLITTELKAVRSGQGRILRRLKGPPT